MACIWWMYLLFRNSRQIFEEHVQIEMQRFEQQGISASFEQSAVYKLLEDNYHRKQRMILGEGSVFLLVLSAGIWVAGRSMRREVAVARQQRNFLLSVTHELKSPIASIRLVLETIAKRTLARDQLDKLTQAALHDTGRLQELIENLLLTSRLETEHTLHKELTDLVPLVQRAVNTYQTKYPTAHIVCDSPASCMLYADPSALVSILDNLLSNALKYSPVHPHIVISIEAHAAHIICRMADNGVGIGEREREKIFKKFYRIGNEDTRYAQGTGLGLYIVQYLTKAHGGSIKVSDNTPKGSIFTLQLPIH
jgi:signal transduction histidine kinase